MQPVGPARWPYNPANPSTYPMRNHDGRAGLFPTGGMPGEAVLTPSADIPEGVLEEVASDDVPGEDDNEGPVGDS
jgi:hypothetical protein